MARASHTVLLTGFAPFEGERINPSWEAVRGFAQRRIGNCRIAVAELPVDFKAAAPALRRALRAFQPRVAVAVGLAGGRSGVSLERVAINVIDARIPDNAGRRPVDVPVLRNGPAAYFSTLPLRATLQALQRVGIPARISQSAGTYVCNQVFYALMHTARHHRGWCAGFVHLPWLPRQAARHHAPGMELRDMQRALAIIVRSALASRD